MKPLYLLPILCSLFACMTANEQQSKNPPSEAVAAAPAKQRITHAPFQAILDEAQLTGAILILDPQTETYYCNDFDWAEVGRLPASTFKIPNSIIALETGVVENAETIFPWDGTPRRMKAWEEDLTFQQAIWRSCVPCYQQIAREVGVDRMQDMVSKLAFGQMNVNDSTLDTFWLIGNSKISQVEQIDFLRRLYQSELPIQARTDSIIKQMLVLDEQPGHRLSGKTGWAIREGHNNGWFVGYLEAGERVYFFATNVDPNPEFDLKKFGKIRLQVTEEALTQLGLM